MKKGLLMLTLMMCAQGLYAKTALEELKSMIESREQVGATVSQAVKEERVLNHSQKSPFFESHSLVFFFASTCPYCHRQAPILKQWADSHGAAIDARSFDGKSLAEFQEPHQTTKELVEAAYFGQPIRYPAIFIMNNLTHVLVPASFGAMNEQELDQRLTGLISKIEAIEQKVV